MMPLGDARLDKPLAALYAVCQTATDWNDPRTATGGSESQHDKPESREPGRAQCDWFVVEVSRILADALGKAQRAQINARPLEPRSIAPDSIGGIETDLVDDGLSRVQSHLLRKVGVIR